MSATINDIARKLNISTATVSRALNDRPGVSSELRQKVLDVAQEVGFIPNMMARSLVTARTQTIGFVIRSFDQPFSADPFYFPILTAVELELVSHDYHVMLDTSGSDNELHLRMVKQQRVDGLILAGPNLNSQFVNSVCSSGLATVLIDNKLDHTKANTILSDDKGGAIEATEHLLQHGHRAIAHIGGPLEWVSSKQRYTGYCEAMQKVGLGEQCRAIHTDSTTVATGEEAAAALLDGPNPPTAIFAANDAMAVGAMRAATARGLMIPDELALIGFDNVPMAEHISPALTTIRIFKEQIGQLAARRIIDLIQDIASAPIETIVSTELVVRRSCGCK
jgi:LacI family transcriptional regulator